MAPTPGASVRLVEIPDAAPPYDCEIHGAGCPAARDQAGAADLATVAEVPSAAAVPTAAVPTAAVPTAAVPTAAVPTAAVPTALAPTALAPTALAPTAGAGAAGTWPRQFAQVMVEILAGVRPARQIHALATDRVRAQIRHLGPILAADRRPVIKRVVTSRPAAGVVEMTVVVSAGSRSRALAMRLEHVAGRPSAPGLPERPARRLCTEVEAR
jgi:Family of unknown function (DUF6459)